MNTQLAAHFQLILNASTPREVELDDLIALRMRLLAIYTLAQSGMSLVAPPMPPPGPDDAAFGPCSDPSKN